MPITEISYPNIQYLGLASSLLVSLFLLSLSLSPFEPLIQSVWQQTDCQKL